jgi:hypothetical protein
MRRRLAHTPELTRTGELTLISFVWSRGSNVLQLPTPWIAVLKKRTMYSAGQMFRLLWKPKFCYCVYKRPQMVPVLSQMNPLHTTETCFRKIHFKIILPTTSWSSEWFLSSRFLTSSRVLHTSLWRSAVCSLLQPPVTASLSGPDVTATSCSQLPSVCVLPLTWKASIRRKRK